MMQYLIFFPVFSGYKIYLFQTQNCINKYLNKDFSYVFFFFFKNMNNINCFMNLIKFW